MKRNLFAVGLCLLCSHCMAWGLVSPTGSRSSSLGNCSVALHDFWSILNNPAGMADWNGMAIGISYENRFSMKELSFVNAAFATPINNIGALGLTFSRFGFSDFSENKIGISYARSFGPHLKIGLQIDYLYFNFSNAYGKRRTATFELGVQSDITDKLCIGAYIFNPLNVKIKTTIKEKIPIVLRFGLSYKITNDFLGTTELEYNSDKNMDYRIGLEYNVLKGFSLRVGVCTNPATACFGVGYSIKWFIIDVSAKMNQYTGVSFQSSMIFRL